MTTAEIITIGDEILIGQVTDTNSAHISHELNNIGIAVGRILSIADDRDDILQTLSDAQNKADIVILTGGLGPTKDDITKHTLCEYFGDTLTFNPEVFKNIEYLFEKQLGKKPNELNRQQAMTPAKAEVLMNRLGTAPGLWFEKGETIFISLPGVPYEMKALMRDEVLPRLQKRFDGYFLIYKTILTAGEVESVIAKTIAPWEERLPEGIKLAYLPSAGRVRLRLSAAGSDEDTLKKAIDEQVKKLEQHIGHLMVGTDGENSVVEAIANRLSENGQTLSVAESCTGGEIARQLTALPGASGWFRGGMVTYATDTKVDILGVPEKLITGYSVVSTEVAEAMATQAKKHYRTDYTIATTGVAGPDKGDSPAPIGTVCISVATPESVFSERKSFSGSRKNIIKNAATAALVMLWKNFGG